MVDYTSQYSEFGGLGGIESGTIDLDLATLTTDSHARVREPMERACRFRSDMARELRRVTPPADGTSVGRHRSWASTPHSGNETHPESDRFGRPWNGSRRCGPLRPVPFAIPRPSGRERLRCPAGPFSVEVSRTRRTALTQWFDDVPGSSPKDCSNPPQGRSTSGAEEETPSRVRRSPDNSRESSVWAYRTPRASRPRCLDSLRA